MTNRDLNRRDPGAKARRTGKRLRALCRQIALLVLTLTVFLFCLLSCGRQDPPAADADETGAAGGITTEAPLSEGWVWREMKEDDLQRGSLVLVNADHGFDPGLPRTVTVYEHKNACYLVKDIYLSVTPETMDALNRWMGAFTAETGLTDVNVVAGHRTGADQQALYESAVTTRGADYAAAYLARPGFSEHHTGLAVDLDTYDVEAGTSGGFDGEGAYAWAVEHAWEYGFIQRYPPDKSGITGINYESWHFRYVGLPHAWVMKREDLCLEEYIDYLRGFSVDRPLTVDCLGRSWRIWYAEGTRVPVPAEGAYEISGNNAGGFIVTAGD